MGILDNSINNNQQINQSKVAARQLIMQARNLYNQLVNTFNNGAKTFWTNPRATPEEIAMELGTDAAELFKLHGKIGSLLSEIDLSAIVDGLNVVGEFEYNEDGTIKIIRENSEEIVPTENQNPQIT